MGTKQVPWIFTLCFIFIAWVNGLFVPPPTHYPRLRPKEVTCDTVVLYMEHVDSLLDAYWEKVNLKWRRGNLKPLDTYSRYKQQGL